MISNQFYDLFKKNLTATKDLTLSKLLENDAHYQHSCIEQGAAEKKYLELDLSDYQRQVVDNFISISEVNDLEYSTLSYLAGIIDGHKIKDILNINNTTNQDFSVNNNSVNKKRYEH